MANFVFFLMLGVLLILPAELSSRRGRRKTSEKGGDPLKSMMRSVRRIAYRDPTPANTQPNYAEAGEEDDPGTETVPPSKATPFRAQLQDFNGMWIDQTGTEVMMLYFVVNSNGRDFKYGINKFMGNHLTNTRDKLVNLNGKRATYENAAYGLSLEHQFSLEMNTLKCEVTRLQDHDTFPSKVSVKFVLDPDRKSIEMLIREHLQLSYKRAGLFTKGQT